MAIPVFQSWGSYNARLAADPAAAPGAPASVAQGDILLLVIEDQGNDATTSLPTVSGGTETWTQLPNSPQFSSGATRLHVYWARASQASPTMPDVGAGNNHTFSRVARFTGGTTTGNPWVGTEYAGGSNAAADATIPGFNTGGADRLIVDICSTGYNGTNAARFSAWTNANLASPAITENHDQTDTIGGGGGFGCSHGGLASAGATGDTTVTEAFAGHGYIKVALAPPQTVDDADAEVAWTELEVPTAQARADVAWAEVEVPTAQSRADVAWAEVEVPTADASAQIAWTEVEIPFQDAAAEVAWAEVEVPTAESRADVAWAEFEVPTEPLVDAQAELAWTEVEVPTAEAAGQVAWAELEVPTAEAQAEVAWVEFEVPTANAQAHMSWSEFEVPASSAGEIAWTELEVPFVDAQSHISWAELEVPTAPAEAHVAWAEVEVPSLDARADMAWAEFEVPGVNARADISWAEFQVPSFGAPEESSDPATMWGMGGAMVGVSGHRSRVRHG